MQNKNSMERKKWVKYLSLFTATALFCALLGVILYVFKPSYELTEKKQLMYKDPESALMSTSVKSEGGAVSPPVFSFDGGFYDEEFYLELSSCEDCRIYYTVDSSIPTDCSFLYSGPICIKGTSSNENVSLKLAGFTQTDPVEKATIIRAVAFDKDGNQSEIITKTYFIGYSSKKYYSQLPTVSLVSDPVNLFDETLGIYSNYEMEEWEREASFAYYDDTGSYVFDQNIGIRLRGSSTRSTLQKDFTIFARSKYGDDHFADSLFTVPTDSLILRHRANSQYEGFLSSLVSDRDITIQEYHMVNLYINGESWGVYSLLSRIDEYYLSSKFGIDIDDIAFLKINHFAEGEAQTIQSYDELVDFLTTADMSVADNYRQACEQIDIQSMIDCYVTNIYLNDIDSNCFTINSIMWRSQNASSEDGKWRFGIYDLDHATSASSFALIDSIKSKGIEFAYQFNYFVEIFPFGARGPIEDPILTSFMASPEFRQQFYDTFIDIATTNFDPGRVLSLLEELPYTEGNEELAAFFLNRPSYIFDYLDDYMLHYDANYAALAAEKAGKEADSQIAFPFNSGTATLLLLVFFILWVLLTISYIKRNGGRRRRREKTQ